VTSVDLGASAERQSRSVRFRGALDETDVRIIEELNQDGRRPFSQIARNIGVSEATARHRYARLLRRGIIQVVAVSDALALGLVFAEIGVRVRGGPVSRAVEALSKVPEVDYIAVCTGAYDLLIEVVCTDNEHMLQVLEESVRAAPGVDQIDTFTILQVPKHSYRWSQLLAE
jgi:Lrp/AsnC family transcriptional regulator, regulator for asnA, asnC and gidA